MRATVTSLSLLYLLGSGVRLAETAQELSLQPGPALDFKHLHGDADKLYIIEAMGSGVALFDYDLDGDLDIYLVNASTLERMEKGEPGEPNRLFRNEGEWNFTDVTDAAGVGDRGYGQGVAVADIDNDADPDLLVTNFGPNSFYRNEGDGTFSKVSSGIEDPRWGASAAFGDIDNDGFLDLYICNYLDFDRELLDRLNPRQYCTWKGLNVHCGPRGFTGASGILYHNQGDGSFEDWTDRAGVGNPKTFELGVLFSDFDLDGDADLYVATDSTSNHLHENLGSGRFREISLESGSAFSSLGEEQSGMGVDAGDVNGDGRPDLLVTNFSDDYNTLYINMGGLFFVDTTDLAGLAMNSLPYLGWNVRLADLDADTDLDIFLVNGHVYPQVDGSDVGESFKQPMQVFLNKGDGTFTEVSQQLGSHFNEPRSSRGAALGDLDGNGSLDAVVNIMDGQPVLLKNELSPPAKIVVLELIGRESNRDGIAATVTAELGDRKLIREVRGERGYMSHSDFRLYIGLGDHEKIDKLTIRWPSAESESVSDLQPGFYVALEGVGVVVRD